MKVHINVRPDAAWSTLHELAQYNICLGTITRSPNQQCHKSWQSLSRVDRHLQLARGISTHNFLHNMKEEQNALQLQGVAFQVGF